MDHSFSVTFSNGREFTVTYPYSQMMEVVCRNIFSGKEYPNLPFLQVSVIIDIGANVGCTALLYANLFPQAAVYALEPASEAFGYLERNTTSLPNVRRFKIGALDRDTQLQLHLGQDASVTNSLAQSVLASQNSETITLRRLSTFLTEQHIGHISILKIDTEGAELPILRDIEQLFDAIEAIIVEYHSESDRRSIDDMLSKKYVLYTASAEHPHRGTLCYVLKPILETRTEWNKVALTLPSS